MKALNLRSKETIMTDRRTATKRYGGLIHCVNPYIFISSWQAANCLRILTMGQYWAPFHTDRFTGAFGAAALQALEDSRLWYGAYMPPWLGMLILLVLISAGIFGIIIERPWLKSISLWLGVLFWSYVCIYRGLSSPVPLSGMSFLGDALVCLFGMVAQVRAREFLSLKPVPQVPALQRERSASVIVAAR